MERVRESNETLEISKNRELLLTRARKINGKTTGEVDSTNYLANPKNKGRIGQVIQIHLGKNPDSNPDADFPEGHR